MENSILVSLITVCLNSTATIEDTIKSVIGQTYSNWEHIIIDGGSKDKTIDIIKSYERQYTGRLRIYQESDKGIYDAMNKGITLAKGEIIGIINSDDWYASDAVENVVKSYFSCSGAEKIITGGLNRMRDDVIIYNQMHHEITFKGLKKGMPLQHPAVFVTKAVYNRLGAFDLSFPHIADYDFIWRCYADRQVKFLFVNAVVSYMREGGASDCLSWKHIWSRTTERYKLRKKYIPRIEAFILSVKFLLREYCFQIVKKMIGTQNIKKVYILKKSIKKKIKDILHSINKLLKKSPHFRNMLVYTYHYARRFVFGMLRAVTGYKTGFLTNGQLLTPKGEDCFFGYYDKSPFSSDGNYYLFLMIKGKKRPKLGEKAKICYAKSADDYKILGETLAWNSQQGAMLRFVSDDWIAWNDFDVKRQQYVTVFYQVSSGDRYVLPVALYDISDDRKHGLTIDFERLNVDAEGYGYIQLQKKVFEKNTYIANVDLKSGKIEQIITIESLISQFPIPENAAFGYFNHLEFNPKGDRFNFIFRYVLDHKRFSRLFTADINGHNIHLLADDEMVSHCTWKDNEHITLWCRINGKNNYYTIKDSEPATAVILGLHTPHEDGHPTYNADRTLMITDTYPDKAEYRHLIVYDCEADQSYDIARLYAPVLLHGPLRCDFHPRWNPNMKQVAIDSIHEGFRGLYLVDIERRSVIY